MIEQLSARVATLAGQVKRIDESLAALPPALPRLLTAEAEFERARLDAEKAWTDALVGEIKDGWLAWPDDIDSLADLVPDEAEAERTEAPTVEEPRMH